MTPHCYNREPFAGRWMPTGRSRGGKPVYRWAPPWFDDRCVTWNGVGIGQPTEKYPSGTPYPMAHGWRCKGCRWLPAKHEGDAA